MEAHIRNRRMHPTHSRKVEEPPTKSNDDDKLHKPVKPMTFAQNAPPPAFGSTQGPPTDASYNPGSSTVAAPQDQRPRHTLSQSVPHNLPSLNIFNQSEQAEAAQRQRDLHGYLNGDVERYSIRDSDDGGAQSNSTMSIGSHGSDAKVEPFYAASVPNPYHSSSVQPPWSTMGMFALFSVHGVTEPSESGVKPEISGQMDGNRGTTQHAPQFPTGQFFGWQGNFTEQMKQLGGFYMANAQETDEIEDPPLLEELGIDLEDIMRHINCVLLFKSCGNGELQYGDFTGPLMILLLFGLSMLVSCNLNFSLVYAIEVLGTGCMYLLFNMLSQDVYVDMAKTAIILGYSLLPICLAPIIWIFSRFAKPVAVILVYLCVAWSTSTASRLFTEELNMGSRKFLVIYPTMIYYLFFAHVAMN
ncbi:yipf5, putative [Babesia ovata]|uniref:Yipf5, putative n=1 Tax=Babesia ovata TaxID=189622 RepID=A0A2H6KBN1_9APIC|nr:yipf5, putative [Babesia ovata]GBE60400.1 yipf5, putative [Babesia ovata]